MPDTLQQEDSKSTSITASLISHAALIISILYFYVCVIGFIYSWFLLNRFGINIAYFAKASDFLLSAFKAPQTLLFALAAMAGIIISSGLRWLLALLVRRLLECLGRWSKIAQKTALWQETLMKRGKKAVIYYTAFLCVLYAFAPAFIFAYFHAESIRSSSKEHLVKVYYKQDKIHKRDSGLPEQASLITTTEKFVFLYGVSKAGDKQVFAISLADIVALQAKAK